MAAPSNETAFSRSAKATPLRASRARASGDEDRTYLGVEVADRHRAQSERPLHIQEPGRTGVDEIVFQAAQPWLFRQSGLDGGGQRDRSGPDPEEPEGRGRSARSITAGWGAPTARAMARATATREAIVKRPAHKPRVN